MHYWEVLAYDEGYQQRIRDFEALAATTGYWAGYYMGSKKPKSLVEIIKSIYNSSKKKKLSSSELDNEISKFQQRELNRAAYTRQHKK